MFDELDLINTKMNEILLRDLDNYSADERKHIICEEYTQIYKHEYMPIVLKNSKPEEIRTQVMKKNLSLPLVFLCLSMLFN